jgi:hypothetical protein
VCVVGGPQRAAAPRATCNVDPLINGRSGRRRMRGSMDVVDAERLQRSGVAMVWVERRDLYINVITDHIVVPVPIILSQ